jgi:hypothetical protein
MGGGWGAQGYYYTLLLISWNVSRPRSLRHRIFHGFPVAGHRWEMYRCRHGRGSLCGAKEVIIMDADVNERAYIVVARTYCIWTKSRNRPLPSTRSGTQYLYNVSYNNNISYTRYGCMRLCASGKICFIFSFVHV